MMLHVATSPARINGERTALTDGIRGGQARSGRRGCVVSSPGLGHHLRTIEIQSIHLLELLDGAPTGMQSKHFLEGALNRRFWPLRPKHLTRALKEFFIEF
jgi:hypothetical protein